MTKEKPLYEDDKLKIIPMSMSSEDHLLFVRIGDEEIAYVLPRGVLKDFARISRGELEIRVDYFNPSITVELEQSGLTPNDLHIALLQAYIEEEERFRAYLSQQKAE